MLGIDALKKYSIPDTSMHLTKRDTMLYAFSVGVGSDPSDERQLRFVYERDLQILPTMATMLAVPYAWIKNANVGFGGKSVHAGVEVKLLRPIPVEGRLKGKTKIKEIRSNPLAILRAPHKGGPSNRTWHGYQDGIVAFRDFIYPSSRLKAGV